jgi:hypothetical protein
MSLVFPQKGFEFLKVVASRRFPWSPRGNLRFDPVHEAWQGKISEVNGLVGASSGWSVTPPRDRKPAARAALADLVKKAPSLGKDPDKLSDPTALAASLQASSAASTAAGDAELAKIADQANIAASTLFSVRTRIQTAFAPGSPKVAALFATLQQALQKAYFSTAGSDAEQAAGLAASARDPILSASSVVTTWGPALKLAMQLAHEIDALATKVTKRGTPSSEAERKKSASDRDTLISEVERISDAADASGA